MATKRVPGGAERQALFDELSALFAQCAADLDAADRIRDAALEQIPAAAALIAARDASVDDARRKAESAAQKAERVRAAAVRAADAAFYEKAQAADAARQTAGIDLDRQRSFAIDDAHQLFENTVRLIHNALAGLQPIADAEKRARDERDKATREAEHAFRDAIAQADAERREALDAALNDQIAAHAAADSAAAVVTADAQASRDDAIAAAERQLATALAALPAARAIVAESARRKDAVRAACREQQSIIEAKLRGDL